MSWEPVSLAHWEASLKAQQANQQQDAREWAAPVSPVVEPHSLDWISKLCDIAIDLEKTHG